MYIGKCKSVLIHNLVQVNSLECADLSALWSLRLVAALRALRKFVDETRRRPPRAKAVTGHRTPGS